MTRVGLEEDFEAIDFRTAMDAGENSDGWVDAGHERNEHGVQHENLVEVEQNTPNTTGGVTSDASQASHHTGATPLKPQSTNNPFLKHKSQAPTDSANTKEKEPTEAWAEFIPNGHENSAGDGASKGKAREGNANPFEDEQPSSQIIPAASSSARQTNTAAPRLPPPPPRNQTYTIKHVRWLDHAAGDSIRTTPILMQNLNGPCPLLALVNAITMSTPPNAGSSLFETLRTREQVSLNLLLEAVVEELMMGRGGTQTELPDMVELYDFLTALHTGMNVNPTFVAQDDIPNLMDFEPGSPQPNNSEISVGGFESTKEMRLYSTFAVPLVHGWLPPKTHPAYSALKRSARTHEDAEILLTQEDELEEKLNVNGLSEEEQAVLQDIGAIKYFLNSSTTQLTEHGLDIIRDSMIPGGLSILFRNNHFSTLYKHPLTDHIFSLVTDMGYVKYDEIVWESLVDVNGAGSELFSGDFRVVSHNSEQETGKTGTASQNQAEDSTQGWTTVNRTKTGQTRKPVAGSRNATNQVATDAGPSETVVQEDADLALALQLQEEEEENARRQSTPARPPQNIPPRGRTTSDSQHGRRRSSPPIQPPRPNQQIYKPPPPSSQQTSRRGERLSLRTSNAQRDPVLQSSSANSSTSAVERPLRGAQPSNSPFVDGQTPPRGRRQRVPDPDAPADEPPPPSYESALEDEPYIPPENSAHHHASPLPSPTVSAPPARPGRGSGPLPTNFDDVLTRAQTQRSLQHTPTQESIYTVSQPSSRMRRRSSGGSQIWPAERRERDKDCVVM